MGIVIDLPDYNSTINGILVTGLSELQWILFHFYTDIHFQTGISSIDLPCTFSLSS